MTERAADWLSGVGEEPFFLWVHYFDPHWPYAPPSPYGGIRRPPETGYDPADLSDIMGIRFRRTPFEKEDEEAFLAAYDGEIAYVDRCLAALLEAVPEGRLSRLLLVVAGDHGEGFGEHDYYFDHGDFLWESGLHVPLILYGPGFLPAGVVEDASVRLLDVAPTILEAAGLPPSRDGEGESLLAAAEGPLAPRVVFSEASKPWNVEVRGVYQNQYKAKSIRREGWKLVVTPFLDGMELFDLAADPGETRNVMGREPEIAADLEAALLAWIREKNPGFRENDLTVGEEIREKLKALGYSR
ncbi:MAG: sulfatase-like hydrolase/transferase [Candidatus Eisenbacteria bacterium]